MSNLSVNSIIKFSLQYRRYAVFLTFIAMLIGLWSLQNLPMEAYPDFTNPLVRIITPFPGKGAEEVERLVTIPLEKEMSGLPRETNVRSVSLFGLSVIYVTFEQGTKTQQARQLVLERMNSADLPDDVKPALDPDASAVGEIFRYTLESDYFSSMSMKTIQDWQLEKAFRQIPGVVDVTSFGGPRKTYQVFIDPGRLKAYNLTVLQVFDAIHSANVTTGGNYIENNGQAYVVRGLGLLKDVRDLENVVVQADGSGTAICVKDVAVVSIGPGIRLGQVGKNATNDDVIEGIVLMRRGEDVSKVTNRLYEKLPFIQSSLPQGIKMVPLYDRLDLVRNTLHTISHNVAEGIVLVVIVLLLFMFNVRSALIAATVIPFSLLFAFTMLDFFHIPANLLSLGAVDFGILVDGSVIMVEHIFHRLSQRRSNFPHQDSFFLLTQAAQEVGNPIIFSGLIIVVAFLPIFCFTGVAGILFHPLAFTMNFALIGAVLMSVTIIPVLCWYFLAKKPIKNRQSPVLVFAQNRFYPILIYCLRHPAPFLLSTVVACITSVVLLGNIGSEFLPALDEGNIWIRVTALPTSVSLEESVKIAREVRSILAKYDEVKNVLSQVGSPDDGTDPNNPSNIEFLVDLFPQETWRAKWGENKQKLVSAMDRDLEQIPGIITTFSQYIQDNVDEAIAGAKAPIVAKIYGPDLEVLQKYAKEIGKLMHQVRGAEDISIDYIQGQPQYQIQVNRLEANRYGINVNDITRVIETGIGGKVATQLLEGEKRFDVLVRFQKTYRASQASLEGMMIATPTGIKIPLSEVAQLVQATGATFIPRSDNSRVITVKAAARGRDLGGTVQDAEKLVQHHIHLPEGYRIVWSGQYQNQQEANRGLLLAIPVTLFGIFILLFILFKNPIEAILGMVPIPLTLIGGVSALAITHTYFSASAGVALIAAMGVSVQNGVVLLAYMKSLKRFYSNTTRIAVKAAMTKLSPVLMVGSLAILGLIPAALSNGIGSQSQKPFAIAIIGGLFSSTLLTPLVLPVLFVLRNKIRFRELSFSKILTYQKLLKKRV